MVDGKYSADGAKYLAKGDKELKRTMNQLMER